jgi:acetyl-CoA carboxylase alpha subunit
MNCGRRKANENKLEIETMEFEKVQSFKYLDSVVNQKNEIEKIKKRINAENKAFYANKQMFQCKLLSKRSKLRLHWSTIRPVVTHKEDLKGNVPTHHTYRWYLEDYD